MRMIVLIGAVLLAGGCTLKDGDAPPLTGPSEYALSVTLSASPDQLPRDGSSQSVVTVIVRDASARPVAGQQLNVFVAVGTVTETTVVTGSDGRASFGYVAPPPGEIGAGATIQVVPVGNDGRNDATRTLVIRFTGAPNLRAPVPDFQTTPEEGKIEVNQSVRFDASKTTDEPIDETKVAPCLDLCMYHWDFGDGSTAVGRIVNHAFTVARTHTVTLTVTDAAGTSASMVKTIVVNAVPAPTVTALTVSPTSPIAGQLATFTVKADPATGHSIQMFAWNFGDGSTQTTVGPTYVKIYSTAGTYVVTVTATDDLGQQGSISLSITVGSGITFPQPPFTVSPATPTTAQDISFNALGVTTLGGATITKYEWDFGDGDKGEGVSITKNGGYATAGTYVVRLTVTDSAGRTGTTTVSVQVSDP